MCDTDGEEENFNELNAAYNRKQKKAGGWQSLGLDHPVFKGIDKKGFRQPTPIQRKAIPAIIDGKDVVAMSRTGSGKTAAFVVPMLQKLKKRDPKGTRALLISPTRELAMQTFKVVKELGKFTGLRCAVLVGGDSIEDQFAAIHENPDVMIATPGRLLHLVVEMNLKLTSVNYVVFDEADRLFEMGFADQLQEVIKRLPENRQTLLFSATLPKMLVDFAKAGLSDPLLVRLDVDTKVSDKLSMIFLTCRAEDKLSALLYLSRKAIAAGEQTIIFCATMKEVEYVVAILERAKLACTYLYSQLDTVARKINIAEFRDKKCNLLVVTDVAARGVDIPLLDNAINYSFPPKAKLFVHRVGRVARAGQSGRSYSLVSPDELPYLVDLFLFFGRPLKFANSESQYKEDEPLVGVFPDHLIDLEVDFLRSIHDNCQELNDLQYKAKNAMGKYLRTRTQPSSESVRRVKNGLQEESMNAVPHPILEGVDSDEAARFKLLQDLRNFKPSSTIFELHTATKKAQAEVMREKRRQHQQYIDKKAIAIAEKKEAVEKEKQEEAEKNVVVEAATSEDVESTFSKVITERKYDAMQSDALAEAKKQRKRRHADQREKEKAEHYIAYTPADAYSEAGFAVDRGFMDAAKGAAVDISADDDKGLYKAQHKKVWDRKTKKFVTQGGDQPGKKRIRTEDGTWLPASYKSGRYETWQQQQKLHFKRDDGNDSDGGAEGPRQSKKGGYRPGQKRFGFKKKSRGRGNKEVGTHQKQAPTNELRSKEAIFKERQKKEKVIQFQNERRVANAKKKAMQKKKSLLWGFPLMSDDKCPCEEAPFQMGTTPNELISRWMPGEELAPYLELSDLIEFRRVVRDRHHVYTHWAVYIGVLEDKHRVIHLSNGESDFGVDFDGLPKDSMKSKLTNQSDVTVRGDEFGAVAATDLCRINNSLDRVIKPLPPSIVRERAVQSLGKGDYSVFLNNCEHFCKWARYGSAESSQATVAKSVIIGSATLAVTGSLAAGATATVCSLGLCYMATRMRRYFSFMPRIFR